MADTGKLTAVAPKPWTDPVTAVRIMMDMKKSGATPTSTPVNPARLTPTMVTG